MKIWVDADACPKVIKDILFRAALRVKIPVTLVANQWLHLPDSPLIALLQVGEGADVADDKIVEECTSDDLVITADIPLAVRIVKKGALALDPRGTLYDSNNIGQISDMRDFMTTLRNDGIQTGGPKNFNHRDRENFANMLDRFITKNL